MGKWSLVFWMGLLSGLNQLCGQSILDKRLDFSVSNLTLVDALNRLSVEAEVPIVFSGGISEGDKKVSFSGKTQSLSAILTALLKETENGYRELNGQLIIFKIIRPKRFFTLSGFVEDASSGERLIGANIFDQKTFAGTATNVYGYFSITLEEGKLDLAVTYLGYLGYFQLVQLDKNIFLEIKLKPSLTLTEVVVIGRDSQSYLQSTSPIGSTDMNLNQLPSMPSLTGESDLMRMMDMLPGVQSGADGFGGLHVRGGTPDQNLILLDGVPVYNVNHLLGMFSMFNDGAIQKATFQKGGFEAQKGGRLSSVVDIRMKDGNRQEYHGGFSLGLLSSRANVEGPIKKGQSSFMLAGRRTFWDWLLKALPSGELVDGEAPGKLNYHFYDWNGKANFSLSEKDKLHFSIFNGGDSFVLESSEIQNSMGDTNVLKAKVNWKNWVGAVRWNRIVGPKIFVNNTLTFSRFFFDFLTFDYSFSSFNGNQKVDFISNNSYIQDFSARSDWDYYHSPTHQINFGANLTHHFFKTLSAELPDSGVEIPADERRLDPDYYGGLFNPSTTQAVELNLYVEDNYQPSPKWNLSWGLNLATFHVPNKTYWSAQPRFSVIYEVVKNLNWQASASSMEQFLHLVTGSNISLPSDIWVPATARIRPQKSWQLSTGLQYRLPGWFKISVEGYYKKMDGLLNFIQNAENPIASSLQTWEDQVTSGQGKSYGLEFFLERAEGKTNGMLSYTLSRSYRQFDEINYGQEFPFHYDRRHFLKMGLVHRFTKKFHLSANFIYGTGNPFTLAVGSFTDIVTGQDVVLYAPKNSVRLPDYHRADVGFVFTKERSWGSRTWVISVYNVYNRQNPFFFYQTREDGSQSSKTYQVSLFPILPAFSYSLQF